MVTGSAGWGAIIIQCSARPVTWLVVSTDNKQDTCHAPCLRRTIRLYRQNIRNPSRDPLNLQTSCANESRVLIHRRLRDSANADRCSKSGMRMNRKGIGALHVEEGVVRDGYDNTPFTDTRVLDIDSFSITILLPWTLQITRQNERLISHTKPDPSKRPFFPLPMPPATLPHDI